MQSRKTVQTRHFQIGQQDVGLMLIEHRQNFLAAARLSVRAIVTEDADTL